jgi:hypothetical protein
MTDIYKTSEAAEILARSGTKALLAYAEQLEQSATLFHEAAWELRKVILAYEAWASSPYSASRASELSVHLCSARDWLEKHDLKHFELGALDALSRALQVRLAKERKPDVGTRSSEVNPALTTR